MTKYYGQDKETDRAVETLIQREVLACQSSLVDALLEAEPSPEANAILCDFQYEDIENLYPDPSEWTAQECRDWCEEYGIDSAEDLDDLDELRDAVIENAEAVEIFEWWLVTTWAAGKLREQGQPILAVGSNIWWGRTTTGQNIALDPTWYDIYEGTKP